MLVLTCISKRINPNEYFHVLLNISMLFLIKSDSILLIFLMEAVLFFIVESSVTSLYILKISPSTYIMCEYF